MPLLSALGAFDDRSLFEGLHQVRNGVEINQSTR